MVRPGDELGLHPKRILRLHNISYKKIHHIREMFRFYFCWTLSRPTRCTYQLNYSCQSNKHFPLLKEPFPKDSLWLGRKTEASCGGGAERKCCSKSHQGRHIIHSRGKAMQHQDPWPLNPHDNDEPSLMNYSFYVFWFGT